MNRIYCALALLHALCALLSAEAQQPTKILVDWLSDSALRLSASCGPHRGIPPGTARAWVVEGKNIVIE